MRPTLFRAFPLVLCVVIALVVPARALAQAATGAIEGRDNLGVTYTAGVSGAF